MHNSKYWIGKCAKSIEKSAKYLDTQPGRAAGSLINEIAVPHGKMHSRLCSQADFF